MKRLHGCQLVLRILRQIAGTCERCWPATGNLRRPRLITQPPALLPARLHPFARAASSASYRAGPLAAPQSPSPACCRRLSASSSGGGRGQPSLLPSLQARERVPGLLARVPTAPERMRSTRPCACPVRPPLHPPTFTRFHPRHLSDANRCRPAALSGHVRTNAWSSVAVMLHSADSARGDILHQRRDTPSRPCSRHSACPCRHM